MKTVLFVHGINKKAKGPVYEGIRDFFEERKIGRVISFEFADIYEDSEKTLSLIEKYIDENNVSILAGTSLGAFYVLCTKRPVEKIVLNPCMIPSKEIPLLTDKTTGENFKLNDMLISQWQKLESYDLKSEYKNASAIFGRQDTLFKYIPNHSYREMFETIFTRRTCTVNGKHSLTAVEINEGLSMIYNQTQC